VITPEDARRCSKAWDFIRLCEDAGISSYLNNYYIWFNRRPTVIPEGPDRLPWLKWLYRDAGYRRAPAFVVLPELQAYRRRGTVRAIANAAGVSLSAVRGWLRKPALKKILREAVRAARKGRAPNSEEFKQLDRRMRECMCQYAKAATKAARCRDKSVGIKTQWLDQQLQEAAGRGVKEELLQYLNYKGPYKAINLRKQYGLINGKLFIIPPAMCPFHDAAVKEWHRQNLVELEYLPGFDAWFLAWATPAVHHQGKNGAHRNLASVEEQQNGAGNSVLGVEQADATANGPGIPPGTAASDGQAAAGPQPAGEPTATPAKARSTPPAGANAAGGDGAALKPIVQFAEPRAGAEPTSSTPALDSPAVAASRDKAVEEAPALEPKPATTQYADEERPQAGDLTDNSGTGGAAIPAAGGDGARLEPDLAPQAKRKGRGRPVIPIVQEVNAYCYELWCQGKSCWQIVEMCVTHFGKDRAPKSQSHAYNNAKD
jgi:hypothetical protein